MATATDTPDSDGTQSGLVTRRQFLAGAAGAAAVTAAPTALSSPAAAVSTGKKPLASGEAQISLDGYHELANSERMQQQKGNDFQFSKKVDAVKDLGCDPNGGKPVQDTLNSKIEDGMLVVFPQGTYTATGEVNPGADRFGIVGKGYQQATKPPKPGGKSVVFKYPVARSKSNHQTERPGLNLDSISRVGETMERFLIEMAEPADRSP